MDAKRRKSDFKFAKDLNRIDGFAADLFREIDDAGAFEDSIGVMKKSRLRKAKRREQAIEEAAS